MSPVVLAGMDYTLAGEFTPGKIGAWRFDKRSYSGKPPPRALGEPPVGMKNELVRAPRTQILMHSATCCMSGALATLMYGTLTSAQ